MVTLARLHVYTQGKQRYETPCEQQKVSLNTYYQRFIGNVMLFRKKDKHAEFDYGLFQQYLQGIAGGTRSQETAAA